jgi:hypothetical protein
MPEPSTSQFFLIAGSLILVATRWLVLIASTILVLFVTWLVLNVLWSRGDKESILIRPFVVVDPSGNLKNAESGFAQILSAQMAELQIRILQARAVLKQAASGEALTRQVDDTLRVPEGAKEKPKIVDPWPKVQASAQDKVELKVQGVDVFGLVSWIKAQIVPERKGLAFTAHIAGDGEVTIAGDVSDMGLDGVGTLYLSPLKRSPIAALDDLALQLFQLRLVGDDARLRDLPLPEFRILVDRLCEAADTRVEARPDAERKEHYKNLSAYFAGMLEKHDDWLAMMILAADTARRGGEYDAALKYFRLASDHEHRLPKDENKERRRLIDASLAAVVGPAAAQPRLSVALAPSTALIARRVLDTVDASNVEQLRKGFQALYNGGGEGGYAAVAGLSGIPGWYSWNHQSNSRSAFHFNLFLAWNRALLVNFERAARDEVKDFALMCWDWTKGGIPTSFNEPNLPDGGKNPLAAAYIDLPQSKPPITRFTERDPAPASELPSAQDVAFVLGLDTWDDFSAALEDQSDRVHGWTGGDMGNRSTSSYDPLFYVHYCNVDRLWAIWQKAHQPLDGPTAMDKSLLDVVLDPFGIKVREVLDTKKLGYTYE